MVYYQRNLPHWQPGDKNFFLTWRLHGSLPYYLVKLLREGRELNSGKGFAHFDSNLDRAAFGPRWLQDPQIAKTVADCIFAVVNSTKSILYAHVIMPNHVHILLNPGSALSQITQAIKGRSAFVSNKMLHRSGKPFWHEESYDHWVRSSQSFAKIQRYIEWNPVHAKLVKSPEDWPWSSASCRSNSL